VQPAVTGDRFRPRVTTNSEGKDETSAGEHCHVDGRPQAECGHHVRHFGETRPKPRASRLLLVSLTGVAPVTTAAAAVILLIGPWPSFYVHWPIFGCSG
jgi:hypothetical protein